MTYLIWHKHKKAWLTSFEWDTENPDYSKGIARWEEKRIPVRLPLDHAISVINIVGQHDVTLVPTENRCPEWFARTQPIRARSFTKAQREQLESQLEPLWDVAGNCVWFVRGENGRDYGPISPHELGGWTAPYNNTRYESVFEAACQAMDV